VVVVEKSSKLPLFDGRRQFVDGNKEDQKNMTTLLKNLARSN
jgi:hypothetical protein